MFILERLQAEQETGQFWTMYLMKNKATINIQFIKGAKSVIWKYRKLTFNFFVHTS